MEIINYFYLLLHAQQTLPTDITPLNNIESLKQVDILGVTAANCDRLQHYNTTGVYVDFEEQTCMGYYCPFPFKTCLSFNKPMLCRESTIERLLDQNCICPQGYQDHPDKPDNSECIEIIGCPSECNLCKDSENCLNCKSDEYYLDIDSSPQICQKCLFPFKRCSSLYEPIECVSSAKERILSEQCKCPFGYENNPQAPANSECQKIQCGSGCELCENINKCVQCISNEYFLNPDTQLCEKCHFPFKKCSSQSQPVECLPSVQERVLDQNCDCPIGYQNHLQAPNNSECEKISCGDGCEICKSESNCNTCISDQYYLDLDTNLCEQCLFPFKRCSSKSEPLECLSSVKERILNEECRCHFGYKDSSLAPSNSECLKIQCGEGCQLCESELKCDSCISDEYYLSLDTQLCEKCPFPSKRCSSQTEHIECLPSAIEREQNNQCRCPIGYQNHPLAPNNSECEKIECGIGCQLCISSSQCNSCISDEYYLDLEDSLCMKCVFPFQRCSDKETPLECLPSTIERELLKECECPLGYENSSQAPSESQCQKIQCGDSCELCENSEKCLQCISDEYYLDSINSPQQCKSCPFPFKRCSSPTDPIQCLHSTIDRQKQYQCKCPFGYEDSPMKPSNSECLKIECGEFCDLCENSIKCVQCISDEYYIDIDSSQQLCKPCEFPFKRCSSKTDPIECLPSSIERQKEIQCQCPQYYEDSPMKPTNSQCQKIQCGEFCDLCENSTKCVQCISDEYYIDIDSPEQLCKPCEFPFKRCSSKTDPIECLPSLNRRDVNKKCKCPFGYQNSDDQPIVSECQKIKCGEFCDMCIDEQNCDNCISDHYYLDDQNSPQICKECNFPYLRCSDGNTPLECINSNLERKLEIKCLCPMGYQDSENAPSNKNCEKIKCEENCRMCSDPLTCYECINDSYYLDKLQPQNCKSCFPELLDDQNVCQIQLCEDCSNCKIYKEQNCVKEVKCKIGYYLHETEADLLCKKCNNKCISCISEDICIDGCEYPCETCTSQKDKCLSCHEGYYFQSNNNKCSRCDYKCKTCYSQEECLVCSHLSRKIENNCACQFGEFENLSTQGCEKINIIVPKEVQIQQDQKNCGKNCEFCNMSTLKCQKCFPGKNRDPKNCQCSLKYHDNEGTTQDCFPCSNLCSECISYDKCTKCNEEENRIFNERTRNCDCKIGFTEAKLNPDLCVKCYSFQGECFEECPINTVLDEETQICIQEHFQKQSKIQFYLYSFAGFFSLLVLQQIIFRGWVKNAIKSMKQKIEKRKISIQNTQDYSKINLFSSNENEKVNETNSYQNKINKPTYFEEEKQEQQKEKIKQQYLRDATVNILQNNNNSNNSNLLEIQNIQQQDQNSVKEQQYLQYAKPIFPFSQNQYGKSQINSSKITPFASSKDYESQSNILSYNSNSESCIDQIDNISQQKSEPFNNNNDNPLFQSMQFNMVDIPNFETKFDGEEIDNKVTVSY